MKPRRALVVLPGRGAFADRPPDVASRLIFEASATDLDFVLEAERAGAFEVVAVCGLSLGWYTALHAAGALDREDTLRLVTTMGEIQVEQKRIGGQIVYPACSDEDWKPDASREALIAGAIFDAIGADSFAARSIRLGGYEVLAGDDRGLARLERTLPRDQRKGVPYPARLPGHSAFHTALMEPMAREGRRRLEGALDFRAPGVPLIDGRGVVWRPRWADPGAMFAYTLGHQVVEVYDFRRSLVVALREYSPDLIVATGPGDALGGPIGQTLVREGWAGIHDRAGFAARQASDQPILLSLGRPADRARLAPAAVSG